MKVYLLLGSVVSLYFDLALSGLNTIADAQECITRHDANENDEAAFERETASCKAWWEREGKYRIVDSILILTQPLSIKFLNCRSDCVLPLGYFQNH